MEQLKHLGGRLLGKKSVATILGLLGLLGPLSLSAEKLDTTFVLDMVIDTTPCYYTEYNREGQIIGQGIHKNESDYTYKSTYFYINIGYVTNEDGKRIDTLYYGRDEVTKQWREIMFSDIIRPIDEKVIKIVYYSNGMIKRIDKMDYEDEWYNFKEYENYISFSENGTIDELVESSDMVDHPDYYRSKFTEKYDNHGYLIYSDSYSCSYHQAGSYWSNGSKSDEYTYNNEYDAIGNLIVSTLTAEHIITGADPLDSETEAETTKSMVISRKEHIYNAANQRIKTINYYIKNGKYVLADSIVYSYRGVSHEGEARLLSLIVDGNPVDGFSPDIHDYWLDREYAPNLVSYNLPEGVVATESFDDSTNILTISVRFATESTTQPAPAISQNMALPVRYAPNNTSVTVEYRIHFRPLDGVDDLLGDQVSLYVMDKTICVDGAEEPLFVYDLLGALVGTGRGEEVRIPVPQAGVYVVRAGGKAAKVVVR